jgi:hypothetical protein
VKGGLTSRSNQSKHKQIQNNADDSYHGSIERVLVEKERNEIIEIVHPPGFPPN